MKFIFVISLLLIVYVILRRMAREQVMALALPMRAWEQRPPIAFDDFYTLHYADSGLTKYIVRSALQQISKLVHAPAERLRPEDKLDDLKPGAIATSLATLRRFAQTPFVPDHVREKLAGVDWNIVTVDDYIRELGHIAEHLNGALG